MSRSWLKHSLVNSISVTFCCIVDDIHSGKTKVNGLKYIVKNGTIFPFNIFLLGIDS